MATKKKFYAIAIGRNPGIYTNWPLAQAQVKGYPGARYRGFATESEAEDWLKEAPPFSPDGKRTRATSPPTETRRAERDTVIIYTDGGSRFNPGPGGYGIVQFYDGNRKEISGGYKLTTNNRMELMACIVALRELEHREKAVVLYSDSSYVVNGINKGWAESWRKRGWIKSDKKPAVNPDLWGDLLDLVKELDITFKWVKGHAGNPFNERCDELAVTSAQQKNLPEDTGYRGE